MLAVLLVGIYGISAYPQNEFIYSKMDLMTGRCDLCYDLQCYTMDKSRCTYYSLANDITGNNIHEYETQNEINDDVDDMIFEYTEKALNVAVNKNCIPLISQYTNCNRDNMCRGCKICSCTIEGTWNCSSIQDCRTDNVIPLNHHTLVILMEKLNDYKNSIRNIRSKRSAVEDKKTEIITPDELLKWFYGVKKFDTDKDFPKPTSEVYNNEININNDSINSPSWSNQSEKNNFNESSSETLLFEDILNNLNLNDDDIHMSLENTYGHTDIINDVEQSNTLNKINTLLSDTTILNDNNEKNQSDADAIIDDVFSYIGLNTDENFNYKRDTQHNIRRLQKRDVNLKSINITSIRDYDTDKIIELQNSLLPFNNIIHERQKELNILMDIREKLITYLKSFSDIKINNSLTNISDGNITRLYFIELNSIQNFDDSRKGNENILNKYLQKFKRDIHEVVQDIAGIQRLSNVSAIPYDLKLLIRALKTYVSKENKHKKIKNINNNVNTIDLRKKNDLRYTMKTDMNPIDEIIKILDVLDSDMPTYNILNSLSPYTRKIFQRIINTFYKDNIINTNLQINKTYNLTRNLEEIGNRWGEMIIDIATNPLPERLYSMKGFYLVILLDIKKLEDALATLQFAQNRRMTVMDDVTGERLIDRISNDLGKAESRFNNVIQTRKSRINNFTNDSKKLSKKKSFLQYIKTLLKNSKMDILKLLHQGVSKSQIVKQIAKKKVEEIRNKKLAEYEQTMQRWQNNLNIISRNKRSALSFQGFINSVKNIIPRYQRSNKKKGNKTENVKKRSKKRGSKKTTKISATTQKMAPQINI